MLLSLRRAISRGLPPSAGFGRNYTQGQNVVKSGRYRHYKGNEYIVLGVAKHSETLEEMVVYKQDYGERGLWVRPEEMFRETVEGNGQQVARFEYIGEEDCNRQGTYGMKSDSADRFQFACDYDGDMHLFPRNLDEPDYQQRWHVWVIHSDGSRTEAPLYSPVMCVNDGVVTNPLGTSGHQKVAGWDVHFMDVPEIEIKIDSEPAIRIRHPMP